ncbi:MAG: hypothetical protein Q8T11_10690 [Elusimicrobiota bacterium]|nr:hypothetical protein [Elusimicrobiota bacterium]
MTDKTFDADADPEKVAAELGLAVVQWHGGALYARDADTLYTLQVKRDAPGGPRLVVERDAPLDGYVGEEAHTPREAAVHAGLTVIEEGSSGDVTALDGFGRKYLVSASGNGPRAVFADWATEDEMKKFTPRHRPAKPTLT